MEINTELFGGSYVIAGTVLVLWGFARFGVYKWRMCTSKRQLTGKTIIITGANTGIGKAAAVDLYRRGARVILACRNREKTAKAAQDIRTGGGSGDVVIKELDLSSFRSIRKFCSEILKQEPRIDVLVNNAGVLGVPHRKTEDGFEEHFGVNHLGHFLMTNILLDRIKQTGGSRIVVVSSAMYKYGEIRFDDINYDKNYNRRWAYANSKLANIYFAKSLNRKLQGSGTSVHSLHPGLVLTEISRYILPHILSYVYHFFGFCVFFRTPVEGAQATIYCVVSEELDDKSGDYYFNCKQEQLKKLAEDSGVADKLWELSERLTGLDGTQ